MSALSFAYVIGLNYNQRLQKQYSDILAKALLLLGHQNSRIIQSCLNSETIQRLLLQCRLLMKGIKRRIISVGDGKNKIVDSIENKSVSIGELGEIGDDMKLFHGEKTTESAPEVVHARSSEVSLILFSIDRACSALLI